MHTLKIDDDGNVITTVRETIMQRSDNVDKVQVLVKKHYKDQLDMTDATVVMRYLLPVSQEVNILYLTLVNEDYKDKEYLQYIIPANTNLTSEAGDVKVSFTFMKLADKEGEPTVYVRETQEGSIYITPVAAWARINPNEMLDTITQT